MLLGKFFDDNVAVGEPVLIRPRPLAPHPSPAAVIAREHGSRVLGNGEAARTCDRLNTIVRPEEYCAIEGQLGSGKSALMNISSGSIAP